MKSTVVNTGLLSYTIKFRRLDEVVYISIGFKVPAGGFIKESAVITNVYHVVVSNYYATFSPFIKLFIQ